jgi:hypothetical protein
MNDNVLSDFSQFGLNLIRVNDSCDISASHDCSIEVISTLLSRKSFVGTKYGVKSLESILGKNNESSKMTTRSELKNVKSIDMARINTWKVSCGSFDVRGIISINHKWSLSHDVS